MYQDSLLETLSAGSATKGVQSHLVGSFTHTDTHTHTRLIDMVITIIKDARLVNWYQISKMLIILSQMIITD